MGVYSEMDMEQFENDEMGPFQMDSHRPDAVEWHEQAGSRQQLPRPPQFLPAVRWRNPLAAVWSLAPKATAERMPAR